MHLVDTDGEVLNQGLAPARRHREVWTGGYTTWR
ncbi:uncharacterized protein M6B38_146655 [Iris pallida]|nr:uncharacterized protein M6B38_146655 [Iris pallida]